MQKCFHSKSSEFTAMGGAETFATNCNVCIICRNMPIVMDPIPITLFRCLTSLNLMYISCTFSSNMLEKCFKYFVMYSVMSKN